MRIAQPGYFPPFTLDTFFRFFRRKSKRRNSQSAWIALALWNERIVKDADMLRISKVSRVSCWPLRKGAEQYDSGRSTPMRWDEPRPNLPRTYQQQIFHSGSPAHSRGFHRCTSADQQALRACRLAKLFRHQEQPWQNGCPPAPSSRPRLEQVLQWLVGRIRFQQTQTIDGEIASFCPTFFFSSALLHGRKELTALRDPSTCVNHSTRDYRSDYWCSERRRRLPLTCG